jgi:hypothetical protein
VWLWSRDDRVPSARHGWLEAARKASFDDLVRAPAASRGGAGIDDDDHLAAYNEYLARLNSPGQRRHRASG